MWFGDRQTSLEDSQTHRQTDHRDSGVWRTDRKIDRKRDSPAVSQDRETVLPTERSHGVRVRCGDSQLRAR